MPRTKELTVNEFGDLICPECKLQLILPEDASYVPGMFKCLKCGYVTPLTPYIASLANSRIVKNRTREIEKSYGINEAQGNQIFEL